MNGYKGNIELSLNFVFLKWLILKKKRNFERQIRQAVQAVNFVLLSAAKSTVTSSLTRMSVRRASSVWLFMGEEWYHFSRQTFKFYEFLLQKSSTVISSSQKLYKTFEKSVFWYHNWNTPTFWCLDIRWNTLTVSLIQLFCSSQSETFYPNL